MLTEPRKDTRGEVAPGDAEPASHKTLPPRVSLEVAGDRETLVLSGDWRHAAIAGVYGKMLEAQRSLSRQRLIIDLSGVSNFDTAGAWLVRKAIAAAGERGATAQTQRRIDARGGADRSHSRTRRAAERRTGGTAAAVRAALCAAGPGALRAFRRFHRIHVHSWIGGARRAAQAQPLGGHFSRGDCHPDRPHGRARGADHHADELSDRRDHCPAGRVPVALFRRGSLRRRPGRHPATARDRRAAHGDHDRRALGQRHYRRNRLDEDARGGRRAQGDGAQPRSAFWCFRAWWR
jgi:ABC-type transporter Mla MlaB component